LHGWSMRTRQLGHDGRQAAPHGQTQQDEQRKKGKDAQGPSMSAKQRRLHRFHSYLW
jgi:hypothetical protein